MESGPNVYTAQGISTYLWAMATTPDGRYAISASADGALRVWDVGKQYLTSVVREALTQELRKMPQPPQLAAIQEAFLSSGVASGHSKQVNAIAVIPDGRHAVSVSDDGTLKTWDIESGREISERKLEVRDTRVTAVRVTPNGQYLVFAYSGVTDAIKVWDLRTQREVCALKGHTNTITVIAITPDGRRVLSGSYDNTLKV